MYIKLFNGILDSSIAENRSLRHFFTDLMLCAEPDGTVLMTKEAIARRINCTREEVETGIEELLKPDPQSKHTEYKGARIIPLEGFGHGWKIINFEYYKGLKSAQDLREKTAERVAKFRSKKKGVPAPKSTSDNDGYIQDIAEQSPEEQRHP